MPLHNYSLIRKGKRLNDNNKFSAFLKKIYIKNINREDFSPVSLEIVEYCKCFKLGDIFATCMRYFCVFVCICSCYTARIKGYLTVKTQFQDLG